MKFILVLIIAHLISINVFASLTSDSIGNNTEVHLNVDIVSRHVWRGIINNSSPSLQPVMKFEFSNFRVGAWASYSVAKETMQEIDIFVGYKLGPILISIYDYYNPIDTLGWHGDFLQFKSSKTRHTLEAIVEYDGTEMFPVKLMGAVMFYGYDKDLVGKNYYSTYFEIGYSFDLNSIKVIPHLGFTPFESYYSSKANIVNLGLTITKDLILTEKFKLPVRSSFVLNPYQNKAFVVVAITL